ncbi:MAG: sigma-70 family RNA polymerase sigma factor [Flavipsychrobacter sp.]|nr:sigma-70 family RNA polymerase sigma factor [Flavipsychrobacter sp.]
MYTPIHTEQQLLAAFATGERYAASKLYSQHFSIVNGWMIKNGASEDDVADVFQEAMMILYEKAQQEEFRLTCAIGTYLFAISKNLWYKKVSRQQKMPGYLPEDTGDEGADWAYEDDINVQVEREAHYEQLDIALEQLGEPCSSLIKAFYHHDKSMQEIAADFGYTNPDNAKTQKYKCLARLRKIFYGMQAK